MQRIKTIKAYLKILKVARDTPLILLRGSEKLTEHELYLLSSVSADVQNAMGEDEFKTILDKFNVN